MLFGIHTAIKDIKCKTFDSVWNTRTVLLYALFLWGHMGQQELKQFLNKYVFVLHFQTVEMS